MLSHTGHARLRYEDAFRAIGHYLDKNQFSHIAVMETPDGFLIKGYVQSFNSRGERSSATAETYLFSNDDIDALLEQAYQRRNSS